MKNKPTLTIGIPAHNEEGNIRELLLSILRQRQRNFTLEKIFVICDGCTDSTASLVKKFIKQDRRIRVIDDAKRLGKSERLNYIYKHTKSDLLVTFDADIVLDRDIEIELMVREMYRKKDTLLVGGRFIPIRQKTFMGKCAVVSYESFEDAFLHLHNGNNFYALMGGANLIKKALFSSFVYPKGTISDQNYLFAIATQKSTNAFRLAKKTRVLFSPVRTFMDWRLLGARSVVGDKADVVTYFGKGVLARYSMPKFLYIRSLVKWMGKTPFYTFGSICMNMYIRMFPYKKAKPTKGMWEITISSKHLFIT